MVPRCANAGTLRLGYARPRLTLRAHVPRAPTREAAVTASCGRDDVGRRQGSGAPTSVQPRLVGAPVPAVAKRGREEKQPSGARDGGEAARGAERSGARPASCVACPAALRRRTHGGRRPRSCGRSVGLQRLGFSLRRLSGSLRPSPTSGGLCVGGAAGGRLRCPCRSCLTTGVQGCRPCRRRTTGFDLAVTKWGTWRADGRGASQNRGR